MPWTPSQHRLFEAAAHDPLVAQQYGIPQRQARRMAKEGVKPGTFEAAPVAPNKIQALAAALKAKK